MYRKNVISSNIESVGYDVDRHILEVEFKGGGIYQYLNVPGHEYESLMSAPSLGSYLSNHIKDRYICNKVN